MRIASTREEWDKAISESKLKPFTGNGDYYPYARSDDGVRYYACIMTVPDATHAVRCGAALLGIKNSEGVFTKVSRDLRWPTPSDLRRLSNDD